MNFFEMTRDERTEYIAKQYGIEDKVNSLKEDLMQIPGVVDVEFDLDGFFDNLNQVIFLTKYDICVRDEDYYEQRRILRRQVFETARAHDLVWSGDPVEDYGQHFYFVMICLGSWRNLTTKGEDK